MLYPFIDSRFFVFLYPVILVLSILIGYYIAEKRYKGRNRDWKASGAETSVVGIFALLLSFTFLSSGNSLKERMANIHNETEAVAGMRRQSLFLSDSLKWMTRKYLVNYLGQQVDFNKNSRKNPSNVKKSISDLGNIYLSGILSYSRQSQSHFQEVQQLILSYNKLNGLFYRNLYAYDERIPVLIMVLLVAGSWLIGILIGFMNGFHQSRHYLVPFIFLMLVTLCVESILDLNNPASGGIKTSYEDFSYQKAIIEQYEP